MIYLSFLLNLVALVFRRIIEIYTITHGVLGSYLIQYATNNVAIIFFVTAVLI